MSLKALFKTDSKKEKEGIWIPLPQGEGEPDARFLVAVMGPSNKAYVAETNALLKKYKYALKTMPESKQRELAIEVFAKTILLDWENVQEYREDKLAMGEKLMAFNLENAKFLLEDLPQVHELLGKEASEFSNFVTGTIEVDVKN